MQDQPLDNNQKQLKLFYIDPVVLSILKKLKEDQQIDNAYTDYLQAISGMIRNLLELHLSKTDLPEEEKIKYLNEFENQEGTETPLPKVITDIINSPEYVENYQLIINNFNKLLYRQYAPKLNQEETQELQTYLETMESNNRNIINIITSLDEANKILDNLNDSDSTNSIQESTENSSKNAPVIVTEQIKTEESQRTKVSKPIVQSTPSQQPVTPEPTQEQPTPPQVLDYNNNDKPIKPPPVNLSSL